MKLITLKVKPNFIKRNMFHCGIKDLLKRRSKPMHPFGDVTRIVALAEYVLSSSLSEGHQVDFVQISTIFYTLNTLTIKANRQHNQREAGQKWFVTNNEAVMAYWLGPLTCKQRVARLIPNQKEKCGWKKRLNIALPCLHSHDLRCP